MLRMSNTDRLERLLLAALVDRRPAERLAGGAIPAEVDLSPFECALLAHWLPATVEGIARRLNAYQQGYVG